MSELDLELHSAISYRDECRVAELLAVAGINVNHQFSLNGWSPLHKAAATNQPNIIRLLHQAGAELEIRNSSGDTPLHTAVLYGRRKCMVFLLLFGARIDSLNSHNKTPLQIVNKWNKNDIVKLPE